jgi:hypothetical protein
VRKSQGGLFLFWSRMRLIILIMACKYLEVVAGFEYDIKLYWALIIWAVMFDLEEVGSRIKW